MLERLHGLPLAATITVALVVKVIILYLLHAAFFSAPPVKKMRMPTAKVEQHLLGAPVTASAPAHVSTPAPTPAPAPSPSPKAKP